MPFNFPPGWSCSPIFNGESPFVAMYTCMRGLVDMPKVDLRKHLQERIGFAMTDRGVPIDVPII